MGTNLKEQAIDGLIEFLSDMRIFCGKAEDLAFKPFMKAVLTRSDSLTQELMGTPEQIQSYIDYANSPVEQRRELLINEIFENNTEQFTDIALRNFFETSSCIVSGGFTFAEMEEHLNQILPPELSECVLKKITKELGLNDVLKLEPYKLGLSPGSVAGADKRLRSVLEERSAKEGEHGSDYEQDVAAALWECSQSQDFGEFTKMLGGKQCPIEVMARIRENARSGCIRILRKTIDDLPDIADTVKDLRAKRKSGHTIIRDDSDKNGDEPLFDNIADKDEESVEEGFENKEQLAEWRSKTAMFTTRELELYQSELSRLEVYKTREEFYGTPDRAKSVTQQLKYMKSKYSD